MKGKNISAFLLLFSCILLSVGILCFALFYEPIPKITDTKLHLFTFSNIEGNVLYTDDEKQIEIALCAYDLFDLDTFINKVKKGDKFFVRILSDELHNEVSEFKAFAVLSQGNEYLSMEQTVSALKRQNILSCILFAVAILVSLLSLVIAIYLRIKRPIK